MTIKNKEINDICKKIYTALNILYIRDIYLLKNDVNEISISHKLACYLQLLFKNYDVDIEFNRNLKDSKKIFSNYRRPDIIIHKRGKNNNNYLIIEIKKSNNNNPNKDLKKIKEIMKELSYKYGIYIEFNVRQKNNRKCFVKKMYFINKDLNKLSCKELHDIFIQNKKFIYINFFINKLCKCF